MKYLFSIFILAFLLLSCGPNRGSGKSTVKKPQKVEQKIEAQEPKLSENDSIIKAEITRFEELKGLHYFDLKVKPNCKSLALKDKNHWISQKEKPLDVKIEIGWDLLITFDWIDLCNSHFVGEVNRSLENHEIIVRSIGENKEDCWCKYEFQFSELFTKEMGLTYKINGIEIGKTELNFKNVREINLIRNQDQYLGDFHFVYDYEMHNLKSGIKVVILSISDFRVSDFKELYTLKGETIIAKMKISEEGDIPPNVEEEEYITAELIGKRKIKQTITTVYPASGKDNKEEIKWFEISKEGKIVEVKK